jgi:hypothetical protein
VKSWAVVGYTYQAEILCGSCTASRVTANPGDTAHGTRPPLYRRTPEQAEQIIATAARIKGVDRDDEHTYDSGDFPKVIFADQVDASERCGLCHSALLEL